MCPKRRIGEYDNITLSYNNSSVTVSVFNKVFTNVIISHVVDQIIILDVYKEAITTGLIRLPQNCKHFYINALNKLKHF